MLKVAFCRHRRHCIKIHACGIFSKTSLTRQSYAQKYCVTAVNQRSRYWWTIEFMNAWIHLYTYGCWHECTFIPLDINMNSPEFCKSSHDCSVVHHNNFTVGLHKKCDYFKSLFSKNDLNLKFILSVNCNLMISNSFFFY